MNNENAITTTNGEATEMTIAHERLITAYQQLIDMHQDLLDRTEAAKNVGLNAERDDQDQLGNG